VANSERGMKEMMMSLGKYARKKELEVNVEKMKMMVFKKRKRKWKSEERKKNVRCERVQDSKESKQGKRMCVGNRKEKMRRWFQEENDDV
jgi:hypothetical protein